MGKQQADSLRDVQRKKHVLHAHVACLPQNPPHTLTVVSVPRKQHSKFSVIENYGKTCEKNSVKCRRPLVERCVFLRHACTIHAYRTREAFERER